MSAQTARAASATLVLLLSCALPETGIDRSVIKGTLSIPPQLVAETEGDSRANDDWAEGVADEIGPYSYRHVKLHGSIASFNPSTGDQDWFRLTALEDGASTLTMTWADSAPESLDTAAPLPDETATFRIEVLNLSELDPEGNPVPILSESTAGSYGSFTADLSLSANTTYGVRVAGLGGDGSVRDYDILLSGFDPNGKAVYVGAWQNADPADRGALLGGTSVKEFTLDPATLSWVGDWTMLDIRSVETTDVPGTGSEDTAAPEDPDTTTAVNEKVGAVFLHGGSFVGLRGGIGPGVLYATEVVEVKLRTDEVGEDVHKGKALTLDALAPVPLGFSVSEIEPNDVEIDDEYTIIGGTPQDLGVGSGAGLVDIVRGSLNFETADPSWVGDNDAFSITVAEPVAALISLDWPDDSYNLDLNLNGPDGTIYAAGWGIEEGKPETIDSLGQWEFLFEPGQTYTFIVLPWSGAAGDMPYTMRIEWVAAP